MRSPAVEWLYGLQHFGIKLGLHNIRALLDVLDRPDRSFPVIHVAGTNGKGSVSAMLDAILREAGMSVGLFTSPHLVRPNERIRIDGDDIDDATLDEALLTMRRTIDRTLADGRLEAHPSFFEVVTATALDRFRARGVDVAVLEVGLGGRLDATNAADTDLSIIVTVGLDHLKSLGPTIERIATEKCGIVRPGVPVVTGVERPDALRVVRDVVARRTAPWVDARRVARVEPEPDGGFAVATDRNRYPGLRSSLPGRHQWDNARVAIVALETIADRLPRPIGVDDVRRGLAATRWPGRLQWIAGRPRMLLDGAHNPEGIAALSSYLHDHPIVPRPVLLFGTTREKELDRVLAPLLPHVAGVVAGRAGIDRAMDPAIIAEWARGRTAWVVETSGAADAARVACVRAGADGVVVVAGSLYLVGDVMTALEGSDAPGPVAM